MATSQDFVNFVCGKELEPRFLQYLFASEGDDILRFASGSVHQTIYFPEAKAFHVCVPHIKEQRRIVGILDEAFEGIATAKSNAERNVANARELFESRLETIFQTRGTDWREKSLDVIGKTQTGSTPSTSDRTNFGAFMPFVKPGDFVADGTLDYDKERLSASGAEKSRVVPAGSALMVCIGATIGKCGYTDRDVTTNQQVNSLTPADGSSAKFIYFQMLSRAFQRRVLLGSGQATLPIINKSKWSALTIWLPPTNSMQVQIAGELDELLGETQQLANLYRVKCSALDALKKSLLHRAFTGQL